MNRPIYFLTLFIFRYHYLIYLWWITNSATNTKPASLNAGMMSNIHVSRAWMPVKAL